MTIATELMGGCDLQPELLRELPTISEQIPEDALGRHLLKLTKLHPQLLSKFRNEKLFDMDQATKQALLDDIMFALKIRRPRIR